MRHHNPLLNINHSQGQNFRKNLPENKEMDFKNDAQDSEFHFWKNWGTINCFRDLMTFKSTKSSAQMDVVKSSMRSIWKLIYIFKLVTGENWTSNKQKT